MKNFLDGDIVRVRSRSNKDGDRTATELKFVRRIRRELIGTVISVDGMCRFEIDPGVGSGNLPISIIDDHGNNSSTIDSIGNKNEKVSIKPGEIKKNHRDKTNKSQVINAYSIIGQTARVLLNKDETVTIIEALGEPNSALALSARMLSRHLLPEGHTKDALADADRVTQRPLVRNPLRRDLRDFLVLTIDDDISQDLDDALSVATCTDGSLRLWVHIADVAEHVTTGSVLDQTARETTTSVYLPGHVRPMIPSKLSEDRLSLLPGVARDTVTVEIRIDPSGNIRSVDVYESLIKSRRRISYTTAAAILAGNLSAGEKALGEHDSTLLADEIECIRLLRTVATRLGFQRAARGGVDSNRFDPELPYSIDRTEDPAHQLIERLMVAANEAVAGWLEERGIPTLYRVHDQLDEEAIDKLEEISAAFGFIAAFPRPLTAEAFAAFSAQLDGNRNAAAVWDVLMGLLGRARYTTENKGHFGLGSGGYLHFTSPLRRYADLCVHRTIKSYLIGKRNFVDSKIDLEKIAARVNDVARRAEMAERDARVAKQLCDFGNRRRRMDGVVVSVSSRGISVATGASPVSAVVPARRLPKGRRLDERSRRIIGKGPDIAVGTRVQIRVEKVEPFAGRLEASLII